MSEANVAHSVSEDRRLVELGIDPDGDPIDNMVKVRWLKEEAMRRMEAGTLETLGVPKYPPQEKVDAQPGS